MSELDGEREGKTMARENVNSPVENADNKGASLKGAVEDHEETLRMRDLLKRTTTTLCSLARNENNVVNRRLLDFKNMVQKESTLEDIERALTALKRALIESEDSDGEAPKDPGTAFVGVSKAVLDELRAIFLSLIAEFDQDFGEDYSGRVSVLRTKMEKSTRIEDILKLKKDILMLFELYNHVINEERTMVTDFISEMSSGLLELERQYLDTINQTGQSQKEDNKFTTLVEHHMEDMKKSAQLSTTLAEFREMVLLRLASIRNALEEKRRSEAMRHERLEEEMESLNQNLCRMKKEVDQVHEKRKALEKEVLVDSLTGVANRRALRERLKSEMYRFQRYGQVFSLVFFDVDRFKSINDTHGHWAGDRCLKEVVKRIAPILRETDLVGRWGGDEFVLIFSATDLESAATVAERLRKLVQNTRLVYHKNEISMTVSVGVTQVISGDPSLESVFNRADKAMYQSKKAGGNMVTTV
ncbi:MAG: GGDEF domain-containing protein [Syntrophobacteraceae bacterium]